MDEIRKLLLADHETFSRRLSLRFASGPTTAATLQDMFLRAADLPPCCARSPRASLYREAIRRVRARALAEATPLTVQQVDAVLHARAVTRPVTSAEVALLVQALAEIPGSQRAILDDVVRRRTPFHLLANRFRSTARAVEIDLRKGLEYCAAALWKRDARRPPDNGDH